MINNNKKLNNKIKINQSNNRKNLNKEEEMELNESSFYICLSLKRNLLKLFRQFNKFFVYFVYFN